MEEGRRKGGGEGVEEVGIEREREEGGREMCTGTLSLGLSTNSHTHARARVRASPPPLPCPLSTHTGTGTRTVSELITSV